MENAAYRLLSPGLGKEVGATLGANGSFYQGFFLAPTVTAAALKGAVFAANVYEKLGFAVVPNGTESRHDIIQAVTFGKPEGVIAFCQGIQAAAPVDSFVSRNLGICQATTAQLSWQLALSCRALPLNFLPTARSNRRMLSISRVGLRGSTQNSVF